MSDWPIAEIAMAKAARDRGLKPLVETTKIGSMAEPRKPRWPKANRPIPFGFTILILYIMGWVMIVAIGL